MFADAQGFEARPPVTIITHNAARRHGLADLSERAGARVIQSLDWKQAALHFDYGRPTGTILCEIAGEDTHDAVPVLAACSAQAAREGERMILSAALDHVDALAPFGMEPHVTWLCQPDDTERMAALAIELGGTPRHFGDVASDLDPQRLRRLADEVSRIARTLANLSGGGEPGLGGSRVGDATRSYQIEPVDMSDAPLPAAEEVRSVLRLRRLREQFFDPALFADPAWDMLLDLLAARIERAQVAVSSLCIAAAVPPTTALRWIKTMTDHGIFERCADPDDGRRIFIRLSDHATASMARYFKAARRISGATLPTI